MGGEIMITLICLLLIFAFDFIIYACCVAAHQADEAMDRIMNGD